MASLALAVLATPASAQERYIFNLAGIPVDPGFNGDGPALKSELNQPMGIAITDDGVLIADSANNRVRLLDEDGNLDTVAGTGIPGYNGDGIQATAAQLQRPSGVAPGPTEGSFYIADTYNQRVRLVSGGVITTVAGTGAGAYNGDNRPATNADLQIPTAVEPFGDGFLIADSLNNRIRFVDSSGIITTVAGNGVGGYSGDGQAATSAQLNLPAGVGAAGPGYYIADAGNFRVRVVTTSNGLINTFAGTGNPVFNGDDQPATSANLWPTDVEATDDGVLIVDQGNNRVRLVSPAGTIDTVAGTGIASYNGKSSAIPALDAALNDPFGVDSYSTEAFVVSDQLNSLLREVNEAPPGACGDAAINLVKGGPGSDRLRGTRRADLFLAGRGRDRVSGRGGDDCLVGGSGADALRGGGGSDVLLGRKGSDRLKGGRGRDRSRCGGGNDRALLDRADHPPRGCERAP